MRLEHIGIAVEDLAQSEELFEQLLKVKPYKREKVEGEGVLTSFFRVDNTKIELLESLSPDSPIARFLARRGSGIHHIAFEVDDLEAEMKRMQDAGIRLLNESPKEGADNKRICFLHPKDCGGVLVELCQEIPSPPN